MKKNNKSIYDKLNKLNAPINKEQTWESIYNREGFPKKEKKRRFLFWYLLGIGLVLGGSLFVMYNSNKVQNLNQENVQLKNTNQEEFTKEGINKASDSATQNSVEALVTSSTNSVNSKQNRKIANQLKTKPETKIARTISINKSSNLDHFTINQNSTINESKTIYVTQKSSIAKNNTTQTKPSSTKTNDNGIQKPILPNEGREIEKQLPLLPILTLRNIKSDEEGINILDKQNEIKVEPPIVQNTFRPWTLEVGLGAGKGMHSVIYDSLGQEQAFQSEHTEALISQFIEARVARSFKSNFQIALSLRYARHRRVFSFEDKEKIFFRQSMPDPYHYLESTISTVYTFYQQNHILDLESMLIKNFNWKKTSFHLGIGGGFNTIHMFSGKSINSGLEEFDLETFVGYKNNLGWHYLYEAGLSQQINSSFGISASISGRSKRDLSTIARHSITPVFFRLGLRFQL